MIILDFIFLQVIMTLLVSTLCGYLSIIERKVLALYTARIGPGLVLMGILAPLTDGIKLFVKYVTILIGFDVIMFIIGIFIIIVGIVIGWFIMPIGSLILLDQQFTLIIVMIINLITLFGSIIQLGIFMFGSTFVYIATMRTLLFSVIMDIIIAINYVLLFTFDFTQMLTIKSIFMGQVFGLNIFTLSIWYLMMWIIIMFIDTFRIPFDYSEAESELVLGLVTEFSGMFFVIFSLLESNHVIVAIIITITIFCGASKIIGKIVISYLIFLNIKSLVFRFRISHTINVVILYITILSSILMIYVGLQKNM